jgi:hypothetical protein
MWYLFSRSCATLVAIAWALPGVCATSKSDDTWYRESLNNQREVMGALWPVLRSAGQPGRLNVLAYCPPNYRSRLVFPRVRVLPAPEGSSGLTAAKAVFSQDKNVLVSQSADGIFHIVVGHVPEAVLHTAIARLDFDVVGQYNSWAAIDGIVQSDEVQTAMKRLKLRRPLKYYAIPVVPPLEGLPHLPTTVTNVTMDQALDLVAKTFQGIVLYELCETSDLYDISFLYGHADMNLFRQSQ